MSYFDNNGGEERGSGSFEHDHVFLYFTERPKTSGIQPKLRDEVLKAGLPVLAIYRQFGDFHESLGDEKTELAIGAYFRRFKKNVDLFNNLFFHL